MKRLSVTMTRREATLTWIYWAFQLIFLPVLLYTVNDLLKDPLSEAKVNFVYFCVNFLFLTVVLRRFLGASFKIAIKRPGYTLQSAFFGFATYFIASWAIGALILWLSPDFANANDGSIAVMVTEEPLIMAVGTVILVPVAEELMYRALIFRSLYNRSPFLAYGVSTILFGAIHVVGFIGVYSPMELGLAMLQYLPAGLCLGWAYARSNTIWAPIIMHIAVNQMGLMSMR